MSCNGCRVLRRGCSEQCIIRPCLGWIESPQAQGNAILFVSKFFGRNDLMSFISAVPESKGSALFQSLLFEACGRTVNPVSGAVGLLSTGNWHICQAAVNTVLAGGALRPIPIGILQPNGAGESEARARGSRQSSSKHKTVMHGGGWQSPVQENTASFQSGISEISPAALGRSDHRAKEFGNKEPKLLNLFAS